VDIFGNVEESGMVRQDTVVVVSVTLANVLVTLLWSIMDMKILRLNEHTMDKQSQSLSNISHKRGHHAQVPD
jgi:hypothetical protein